MLEETLIQMFFCEYREIFKNSFFIEYVWWLLLNKFINVSLSISQQKDIAKGVFLFEIIYVS